MIQVKLSSGGETETEWVPGWQVAGAGGARALYSACGYQVYSPGSFEVRLEAYMPLVGREPFVDDNVATVNEDENGGVVAFAIVPSAMYRWRLISGTDVYITMG